MSTPYDKKAVKILFDTYWGAKGWRDQYVTEPSDLAYAIGKGVMFPPALLPHDASINRLREICEVISPARVGDAFLVSLGSRDLVLRSAFGSFAVARARPAHKFSRNPPYRTCRHCDLYRKPTRSQTIDLNVLNFERLKWGGVRHTYVSYELFDLEKFLALEPRQPTEKDVDLFRNILATVRTLPPEATAGQLEKALSDNVPSNKSERQVMINILCYSGILAYPGYRDYFDDTEPPKGRPYRDTDWNIPAMYWRAQDGYNIQRLKEYFPNHAARLATA